MELFIPSLVVLVLGAIVVFFIMPKMSPQVLGITSVILLCIGIYQHTKSFPYEYQMSHIGDIMKDYAPFVMIGATIIGFTVAIMVLVPGSSKDTMSSALPPAAAPSGNSPSAASPKPPASMPSFSTSPTPNARKASPSANAKNNSLKRNNIASTSYKVT